MTELSELMARARARQADVGGFDPDDLIEVDEGHLSAAVARRRRVLRVLLAELLVASERREDWYVWVRDEWPRYKRTTNPGASSQGLSPDVMPGN